MKPSPSPVKDYIANTLPGLGKLKRLVDSYLTSQRPVRTSYSQHGEDKLIYELLVDYNLANGIYVDIGANHPTSISNTYLFYRHGYKGIVIEPNRELIRLFEKVRSRDIALCVGCGKEPAIAKFQHSKTPVLSSFGQSSLNVNVWKTEYLPVFPVDFLMRGLGNDYPFIYFMSIDVEGYDYDVLLGAEEVLVKTLYVCIEANDDENEKKIIEWLITHNFQMAAKVSCNLVFKNSNSYFDQFLKRDKVSSSLQNLSIS